MIETTVRLKPVDRDGPSIEIFKEAVTGKVVIGRGEFLRCADKKVSRVHAELELESDGTLYLTALHVNPCFYYEDGKEELQEEIRKGSRQRLKDEDHFSLLPSYFIFKVVLECVATSNNDDSRFQQNTSGNETTLVEGSARVNGNGEKDEYVSSAQFPRNNVDSDDEQTEFKSAGRKRTLPSWLLDESSGAPDTTKQKSSSKKVAAKRNKSNENDNISRPTTSRKTGDISDSDESVKSDISPVKMPSKVKYSVSHSDTDNEQETDVKMQKKEAKPGNSVISKTKRRSCYFGEKCFRKNPSHLEEYSHPGDSDYASDDNGASADDNADDGRPECEYGLNCYRKNPQHRTKYKHTKQLRPQRRAAKEAKKRTAERADNSDASDSFIDDDSDEYNPSKDDCDYSGDDCDLDNLKKEAESFVKNKKFHNVY